MYVTDKQLYVIPIIKLICVCTLVNKLIVHVLTLYRKQTFCMDLINKYCFNFDNFEGCLLQDFRKKCNTLLGEN